MKIKIFGKINLWDTLLIILISLFCWTLLRSILPNYPRNLTDPYNLCNHPNIEEITPSNRKDLRIFKCKTKVPIDVLFHAKTINVKISSNREASMKVFLHRNNGSGGLNPEAKRIFSNSTSGNLVTYDLDHINNPKINWLTGDYEEVIFEINNFKSLESIKISIQKANLQ